MPPRISEKDRQLLAAYIEAADRLRKLLDNAGDIRREVLIARAQPILRQLEQLSIEYLRSELPEHYRRGSKEAIRELKKLGISNIDETFSAIHTEAIKSVVDDGLSSLSNSVRVMQDNLERGFRIAERQKLVNEVLTGIITGTDVKKSAVQLLRDQNITSIALSNRTISIEQYVSTVVNTITAEAHNTAASIRYAENGVKYYKRIEREGKLDRACSWAKDKVFSMDIKEFRTVLHPNCFGTIVPILTPPADVITSLSQVPEDVLKVVKRT